MSPRSSRRDHAPVEVGERRGRPPSTCRPASAGARRAHRLRRRGRSSAPPRRRRGARGAIDSERSRAPTPSTNDRGSGEACRPRYRGRADRRSAPTATPLGAAPPARRRTTTRAVHRRVHVALEVVRPRVERRDVVGRSCRRPVISSPWNRILDFEESRVDRDVVRHARILVVERERRRAVRPAGRSRFGVEREALRRRPADAPPPTAAPAPSIVPVIVVGVDHAVEEVGAGVRAPGPRSVILAGPVTSSPGEQRRRLRVRRRVLGEDHDVVLDARLLVVELEVGRLVRPRTASVVGCEAVAAAPSERRASRPAPRGPPSFSPVPIATIAMPPASMAIPADRDDHREQRAVREPLASRGDGVATTMIDDRDDQRDRPSRRARDDGQQDAREPEQHEPDRSPACRAGAAIGSRRLCRPSAPVRGGRLLVGHLIGHRSSPPGSRRSTSR